jgi:hypothetical protein
VTQASGIAFERLSVRSLVTSGTPWTMLVAAIRSISIRPSCASFAISQSTIAEMDEG